MVQLWGTGGLCEDLTIHSSIPPLIHPLPSIHPHQLFNHTAIHPFNHDLFIHPAIYLNIHHYPFIHLSPAIQPSNPHPPIHPSSISQSPSIEQTNHLSIHPSSHYPSHSPPPKPIHIHQSIRTSNTNEAVIVYRHLLNI